MTSSAVRNAAAFRRPNQLQDQCIFFGCNNLAWFLSARSHHPNFLKADLSGQSLPVMRRELVCGFPKVSWSADSKGDRGGVAEGRLAETDVTVPLHAEQRA